MPGAGQRRALEQAYPGALLFLYPKSASSIARDFKWLGSYRYAIVHLGGENEADLRRRCEMASVLLGWAAPYADQPRGAPRSGADLSTPPRELPVFESGGSEP